MFARGVMCVCGRFDVHSRSEVGVDKVAHVVSKPVISCGCMVSRCPALSAGLFFQWVTCLIVLLCVQQRASVWERVWDVLGTVCIVGGV